MATATSTSGDYTAAAHRYGASGAIPLTGRAYPPDPVHSPQWDGDPIYSETMVIPDPQTYGRGHPPVFGYNSGIGKPKLHITMEMGQSPLFVTFPNAEQPGEIMTVEFAVSYGSDHSVHSPTINGDGTLQVGSTAYTPLVSFPANQSRTELYVANTTGSIVFIVLDDPPITVVPISGSGTQYVVGGIYTSADCARVRIYGTAGTYVSARETTSAVIT